MIKKVLVVGGAGYIGGGVTDYLIANKIPFTVYDNLTYENHYLKPVEFIHGDIRDHSKLKKLLPKYSHVIWLAALVGDGACAIKPKLTKEINQESLEWLSHNYNGRIIFTSTCSVYGAHDKPVHEKSPTNPLSAYAKTKLAAEKALQGKNALIFRLGTAYGISDHFSRIRMDLAVNYMTMNAIKKGALTVFGGKQWRPFIHVNDIAKNIVKNIDTKHKGIFNIATFNLNIINLAQKIKKHTNCQVNTTPQKFQDNRNYFADVSKAIKAGVFDKKTERTIEHGIKEIKKLVLDNRVNDLEHEFYCNEKRIMSIIDKYINNNNINK